MPTFLPVDHVHSKNIDDLCHVINDWATKKGWNESPIAQLETAIEQYSHHNQGFEIPIELRERLETALKMEQHMLFVTEIAESAEGLRAKVQPSMDDKVPELTSEEAELADTLIRIFHYSGKRGLRLGLALKLKHEYNISRPYKHGKSC